MEKPKINIKKYKVEDYNYYHTKHKKNQIILAGSLRKKNFHIKRLQKKDYGKTKKWNTFTISREGTIYQHFDPKCYTDFMVEKEIDKHSISIVLENMGFVFYDYDTSKFLNWAHEICEENLVFEKSWKNYLYWENYSDEQFDATSKLCEYLCERYRIPLDSLGFNVHHADTHRFKGIVTRSNFNIDYTDLNPSFNFRLFLKSLNIDVDE